jgi:hypothetical protein
MAWLKGGPASLFLTDEEKGKKDDDHKQSRKPIARRGWHPARVQPRRGLRRVVVTLLVGGLVWLFVKNIPTDVPIRDRRRPVYRHPTTITPIDTDSIPEFRPGERHRRPPAQPPPSQGMPLQAMPDTEEAKLSQIAAASGSTSSVEEKASAAGDGRSRDYNGPVEFSHLSESLHRLGETKGSYQVNRNVLFVAASLKSVSQLLPMACQMSTELRSYVHFALMSRSEMSFEEIKEVNGIDSACVVFFHGR